MKEGLLNAANPVPSHVSKAAIHLDGQHSKKRNFTANQRKFIKLDWQMEAMRIDEIEAIIGGLKSLIFLATSLL